MYKCPNHPKKNLRISYTYKDIYWCDLCVKGWEVKDLKEINGDKIFLISNMTDACNNPDYPFIYLKISKSELEILSNLKKSRDLLEQNSPIILKRNKIVIDSFFKDAFGLERLKLEQDDDSKQEDLQNLVKKKGVIQDNNLKLNLTKSRAKTVTFLHCLLHISETGICFENHRSGYDYEQIESAFILWKDLGDL